jgi:hypothetical protein
MGKHYTNVYACSISREGGSAQTPSGLNVSSLAKSHACHTVPELPVLFFYRQVSQKLLIVFKLIDALICYQNNMIIEEI